MFGFGVGLQGRHFSAQTATQQQPPQWCGGKRFSEVGWVAPVRSGAAGGPASHGRPSPYAAPHIGQRFNHARGHCTEGFPNPNSQVHPFGEDHKSNAQGQLCCGRDLGSRLTSVYQPALSLQQPPARLLSLGLGKNGSARAQRCREWVSAAAHLSIHHSRWFCPCWSMILLPLRRREVRVVWLVVPKTLFPFRLSVLPAHGTGVGLRLVRRRHSSKRCNATAPRCAAKRTRCGPEITINNIDRLNEAE